LPETTPKSERLLAGLARSHSGLDDLWIKSIREHCVFFTKPADPAAVKRYDANDEARKTSKFSGGLRFLCAAVAIDAEHTRRDEIKGQ
jgi:hypothetical protein